ncbi:uncharacterized protein LOC117113261 [Anneissia japonica]|uniref:uncharacterized protein LOC117113261 n=1 Tax=Anneissia japonica TaxID=1529436 RepID=UPI0014256A6A|nr:uncharacterized protein LOC117113261 [Anneissia japonica]
MSIALMVFMSIASPVREGSWNQTCSSYDCRNSYNNCCIDWVVSMPWGKIAVDVAILVVAVVELVASLLATTLSFRNTNWVKICCLKKNMDELQAVSNSVKRTSEDLTDESSPLSGQSPGMKRCWKPFESKDHRKLTITLSVIDIIIGVICVVIGILGVFVETRFAHVGIPIWSGLLIFAVTGIFGLLSVTKKGEYIPCFFSLSILALLMSINMLSWASDNIQHGYYDYRRGCIDWSCNITTPTISPYDRNNTLRTPQPHCYDCLPGCCQNGNIYKADKTNKVLLDSFTVGFGVLEMLICMVTIGLSFSQLSCYVCCRCNCCPRVKVGSY